LFLNEEKPVFISETNTNSNLPGKELHVTAAQANVCLIFFFSDMPNTVALNTTHTSLEFAYILKQNFENKSVRECATG